MSNEEKQAWLKQASNEDLLRQLCEMYRTNSYGCNDADIKLTKAEIFARMGEK